MSAPQHHDVDDERDGWLAQALRHAPDADAQAPQPLSDAILRQARAALPTGQAPRKESKPGTLQAWWSWLARPPVASGFAGVLVATLAGVMWWGQPLDDALHRAPMAESTAPPPPSATVATRAPQLEGRTAAMKAAADARATRSTDPAPAGGATAQVIESAPTALLARPTTPAWAQPVAKAERSDATGTSAPPPPSALQQSAAIVPPAADTRALEMRLRSAESAAIPGAAPPGAGLTVRDTARADPSAATALGAMAAPAAARTQATASTPQVLLAAIASEPLRWQWQRDGGEPQAMTDALQRWLAQLATATASHWREGELAASPDAGIALHLRRAGAAQARLRLGVAVSFEPVGGTAWQAQLPAATIDALKQALAEAAP